MSMIAKRLDAHFVACAAAAGAAIAGGAQTADAAVVMSGPVNINIPYTTQGVYLNVVTGQTGLTSASTPGWDVNPWSSSGMGLFTPSPSPGGGSYVTTTAGGTIALNLAPGTLISAASNFGTNSSTQGVSPGGWNLNSSNNIVGFRFINEANGNAVHYGWMRISLGSSLTSTGGPRAIVEYAYEDQAGVGILAGVPAPGGLAALALGALARRGRRRVA